MLIRIPKTVQCQLHVACSHLDGHASRPAQLAVTLLHHHHHPHLQVRHLKVRGQLVITHVFNHFQQIIQYKYTKQLNKIYVEFRGSWP